MAMKSVMQGVLGAAVFAATMAMSAAPASAAVVCNRWHECWRVRNAYVYPRTLGIVVRDEVWVAHHPGWRWRATHSGRGYWRHGRWCRW